MCPKNMSLTFTGIALHAIQTIRRSEINTRKGPNFVYLYRQTTGVMTIDPFGRPRAIRQLIIRVGNAIQRLVALISSGVCG